MNWVEKLKSLIQIWEWNVGQAHDGFEPEHNLKQAETTAQYWGKVGYEFYKEFTK